jgi:uncharacterized surface anchored protein
VAIGTAQLSIVPPAGCVVDTSTVSSVAVAADAVTTIIGFIQQPAQATIRVTDTAGSPVSGALVTVRRADGAVLPAVLTDANGDALFAQLLYSDYSATIAKDGYPSATAPFVVSVSARLPVVPVTISPTVGVGITVRVTDANETAIPGAVVSVRRDGDTNPLQSGAVGSNGEISFTGLDAGTYHIAVVMSGYVNGAQATYLHDGDQDTLDVHLTPVISQGNLLITTRDHHDHLVGHLRVVVDGPDPYYVDNLYTDHYGALLLQNLIPGSYQVRCYSNSAGTVTVIVNGGQTAEAPIAQR